MAPTVLVVGASLGGLRTAEQLRTQGFDGRIVVVGDEPWMPYNRPPLSKEALLDGVSSSTDAAGLATALAFRQRPQVADVEWRLGSAAVATSLAGRTTTLADGAVVAWDGLVVATGLRPRRLPQPTPTGGRHVLRTVADAVALRREAVPGSRVVVIGGGFIGCETASTLHALGCDVIVVEPMAVPMLRGVGAVVGEALLAHHRAAGVAFVTGSSVDGLIGDERVEGVRLDDGTVLACDLLVESVGSVCNVEWLDGNGLDLSDGARCDNDLRVEGCQGVVAVGDIACFPNPRFDDVPRRVEHWSIPGDTARRAAATLLTDLRGGTDGSGAAPEPAPEPFRPLPSFWSDQFGLRIQSFGSPGLADGTEVVDGDLARLADGVAVVYRRDDEPVGVLLVDIPVSRHQQYRALVAPSFQPA